MIRGRTLYLLIILLLLIFSFSYYYFFYKEDKKYNLKLTQTGFSSLIGWNEDNHLEAIEVFRLSCEKIITLNPKHIMGGKIKRGQDVSYAGVAEDWYPICNKLLITKIFKKNEAKKFFEKWFKPYKVTKTINGSNLFTGEDLGLFTGYYETIIQGNYKKTDIYNFPLYSYPPSYQTINLGQFKPSLKGDLITVKVINNKIYPPDTRKEINEGKLSNNVKVIYWLKSDIDAFFLHIQGSGIIELPDGKKERVSYAGSNGHNYYPIGKYLIENGIVKREDLSMAVIRTWLKNNKDKRKMLFEKNKRYIFFKKLNLDFAVGAQNTKLVKGRSLAIDTSWMPMGIPVWLEILKSKNNNIGDINKLMIIQDTGKAIKGIIRGDYYWGSGADAGNMAGSMNNLGRYYVLLPKTLMQN